MFDTASAVLLTETNVCEVGSGCRACEDEACLPSSRFPTAPLAPVGTQCPGRLLGAAGPNTRYLIAIPPVATQSQAGLPQFFRTTTSEVVSVTPPAGTDSFATTRLGTQLFPPDSTGSCGGGLCGILEFQNYASLAAALSASRPTTFSTRRPSEAAALPRTATVELPTRQRIRGETVTPPHSCGIFASPASTVVPVPERSPP